MRARVLILLPVLAVTALAAAPVAGASCIQQTLAEQIDRAVVAVEGEILPGARPGRAQLRVSRYLKDGGPGKLAVVGGSGAGVVSSIDIDPRAGERWRILGRWGGRGTVVTNVCDGSARVDERGRPAPVDPAASGPVASAGSGSPAWLPGVLAVIGILGLAALGRG